MHVSACTFEVSSPCKTHVSVFISSQQPDKECLVPTCMHAIDGCNSQKCDKTVGTCDEHIFNRKYFLSHSFVDGFKDEVRSHATAQKADKTLMNNVELEDGSAILEGEQDDCCGSDLKGAPAGFKGGV